MTFSVLCPRCARKFAFDDRDTPIQRAGVKGSVEWRRVVAYYPTCPHCREKVEITSQAATTVRSRPAEADRAS